MATENWLGGPGRPSDMPIPPNQPAREPEPADGARMVDAGKRIADYMVENNYHPVCLFGTSDSGKTTLLASLCALLRKEGRASFDLGPWMQVDQSAESLDKWREAQNFFNLVVREFEDGKAPDSTRYELPYVVPLVVTPTDSRLMPLTADGSRSPIKLAVIDMRGEWFKPKPEEPGLRLLPRDIERIFQMFDGSVSIIHHAPTSRVAGYSIANAGLQEPWEMSSDLDSRIKENPDDALYGAIKAYDLVRTNKTKDRHLFLVTKWDLYANEPSPQFAAPIANGVDAYLGDRYSKSWSAFLSMRVSREAKWYMPHCSGIIAGNNVKKLGKISETRVDKYGKVLWNWLYANAAAPNIAPEMALFPEVVPPKPSFINKLLFGVTAR